MWTWTFWKQAIERAIKTAAQVAAALLTGDGLGVLDLDWLRIGSVALLAAIYSLLTSVGSGLSPIGPDNSPSLVETEK